MSKKSGSLRRAAHRLVGGVTLVAFGVTTVSPSLVWAQETREIGPVVRGGDLADPGEVQEHGDKIKLPAPDEPAPIKELLPKDVVRDSIAGETLGKIDPQVASGLVEPQADTSVLALPTGADKSGVMSQSISVPKGSGTIQGMGESFSAQLSTGIATFSVPFALPAARGGAQPSLGLSYSSGSGAGLAGMGWSVGVPFIARQTDRGLPGYDDRADWHPNQDRFVFNGGQELVPICTVSPELACAGAILGEVMPPWGAGHQYFRPRVEGSFLRFFWSPDHLTWRVQDKSGVTMELGVPLDGSSTANRTAIDVNPDNASQIYRWHLVRQYDTYGTPHPATGNPTPFNVVVYRYLQDGGQAYLSDIYDTTPVAEPTTTSVSRFAHHTRLEYEPRTDPSESYRSGWLTRQALRLKRVDVTSKTFAAGEGGGRHLVRRYHLDYDGAFHTSYLASVQVEGRCSGSEGSAPAESDELLGGTSCERLPPMSFGYSHVEGFDTSGKAIGSGLSGYEAFDARLQQVNGDPPHSVDEELTDYFDINSDGLPDVLVTAPGTYGDDFGVFFNSEGGVANRFGPATQVGVAGVLGANSGSIKLSNRNVAPLDLDGDGIIDFLHMPKVKTYSVYTPKLVGEQWTLVGRVIEAASQQNPKIDLGRDTAETRVVDVNFDGLVDLVVSTGTEFQTFLALGRLPEGDAQFGHGSWVSATTSNLSNNAISKCVPYSGTPVRFSDPDIQLADMNGDGIQDIVRLRRGDVRYWPGRGNGFWGTGLLDDCPAGSFGDKRYLAMADAPYYSDIQGTSLRMDDVNGDGLDDLVQVRFDAIDVWLNVDGKGWTQREILDGTPESPAFADRVRLLDINGSGTRDVVWGNGKRYQFMDLSGGERPGLLVRVENGLGKSTDIEYETSTQEMLEAERTGAACDASTAFERAWCTKMPLVTHLVKRTTESDNLSVAGSGPASYITEYSYRDPVYEGRQREFRGFSRARSKRIGDSNSPTDFTESTFLLGECEDETQDEVDDCAVSERWRDNPREALKGLPIITERYDEQGVYLSTEATSYRLRELYLGLDGRAVRHAFQNRKRTTLYDTASATASSTSDPDAQAVVELETSVPAAVSSLESVSCGAGLPAETFAVSKSNPIPRRASSGLAVTETSSYVDAFGNQTIGVARGCVAGDACPAATTGLVADELICSFSQPTQVANWLFRTTLSWARGSINTTPRKKISTAFDTFGAPTISSAVLKGSAPLKRLHATAGRTFAAAPTSASVDSPAEAPTITLSQKVYDARGNVSKETGPNGRCRTIEYNDSSYGLLPIAERQFTGVCETGASLRTAVPSYDAGFGLATDVEDMTGQHSLMTYDSFGRLTEMRKPRPDGAALTETTPASVKITYELPEPGSFRSYSVIHTETQDGASVGDSEYLQTSTYVDGMGRTRVTLAEADQTEDDAAWIVSSVIDLDAKGAVRRKYLPFFLSSAPTGFPVGDAAPDVGYGRQRYDAFGRQLQTFDVDGTVTLQSRYHALSTDLFDAADLSPGPHQGSYASTRTDGHGRTVATTERIHVAGVLEKREVRTTYLPTGEPITITRVRVDKETTSPPVMRWMRYDSLGRMVVNADPHATVFTGSFPGPDAYTDALRTWRYVYNDAGDLVGTSDARGCGQNFYYDNVGRLTAEDYSPCIGVHGLYSAPNFTTTNGIEVLYQYDVASGTLPAVGLPPGYASGPLLQGRLVAVHDRAASTWFKYDARGRTVQTSRKVARDTGAAVDTIAQRYRPRWYQKNFTFDAADRPVTEDTGATTAGLLANDSHSLVTSAYTRRGTLKSVSSSYGDLVTQVKRSADGLVHEIHFGDGAATTTHSDYDSRRRLRSVQTYRSAASAWSADPPSITPAPGADPSDPTRQLLLQDLDYAYDVVNNPTEVRDWRTPEEWPDSAKPVTRRMEYDDLYRVTRLDYEYPGGSDAWRSPFAAEHAGVTDARRAVPMNQRVFAKRPAWQTYQYDWLGNTTATDDDQHALWDRSLGTVTHNDSVKRPYQFKSAAATGPTQTVNTVTYDDTGNLKTLTVARSGVPCTPAGANCGSNVFTYEWDEVGRLIQARPNAAGPFMSYLYDYSDERVIKNYQPTVSSPRVSTLYIFDSLEIRRTTHNDTLGEYPLTSDNEVAYLTASGMRLGRLHYEPTTKGEPRFESSGALHAANLHVLMNLPDHLGSSSIVIDHATGELVEARSYQPYGASESDYRPERWKAFREDYGFTGKEEDIEVGLQYFGKRYLSPYLGRWVSADPLAVHAPAEADWNLYAYVRGRSLRAIDPLGLTDYGNEYGGTTSVTQTAPKGPNSIGEVTIAVGIPRASAQVAGGPTLATETFRMAGAGWMLRPPAVPTGLPKGLETHIQQQNATGSNEGAEFNTRVLDTATTVAATGVGVTADVAIGAAAAGRLAASAVGKRAVVEAAEEAVVSVSPTVRELRALGVPKGFQVHHILPEYLGKMLGYTKKQMVDHPGAMISQLRHTGKLNEQAVHKAIARYLPPQVDGKTATYTAQEIRIRLAQAYADIGESHWFSAIDDLIPK